MGKLALQYTNSRTYLQTPHWQRIRDAMLWLAGNRCQVCKNEVELEVHHAAGEVMRH
jgi:hypothetical protein